MHKRWIGNTCCRTECGQIYHCLPIEHTGPAYAFTNLGPTELFFVSRLHLIPSKLLSWTEVALDNIKTNAVVTTFDVFCKNI